MPAPATVSLFATPNHSIHLPHQLPHAFNRMAAFQSMGYDRRVTNVCPRSPTEEPICP